MVCMVSDFSCFHSYLTSQSKIDVCFKIKHFFLLYHNRYYIYYTHDLFDPVMLHCKYYIHYLYLYFEVVKHIILSIYVVAKTMSLGGDLNRNFLYCHAYLYVVYVCMYVFTIHSPTHENVNGIPVLN